MVPITKNNCSQDKEKNMRLYYGVWDGVVHDNRGTADYKEPEGLDLKNLLQFNNGNPVMTFISHRGFLVFHPHANLLLP